MNKIRIRVLYNNRWAFNIKNYIYYWPIGKSVNYLIKSYSGVLKVKEFGKNSSSRKVRKTIK